MAPAALTDAAARSILSRRLRNQALRQSSFATPGEVVAWHGAVQAQEYAPARWALGLRAPGVRDAAVDEALAQGTILRTHVMRPTWHFVVPRDIRWMQELTAPRVRAAMAPYDRKLELDGPVFARSHKVLERALGEKSDRTREELAEVLRRAGIRAQGHRLAHLMMRAEIDQVICSGPRRGKQFTYALIASRASRAKALPREEALAELALRYFRSHGPATVRDYSWWSGLTMPEARVGIELVKPVLEQEVLGGLTYWSVPQRAPRGSGAAPAYLLPIYDEYMNAYRNRDLVVSPMRGVDPVRRFVYNHYVVVDGRLAGSWLWTATGKGVLVTLAPFEPLTRADQDKVEAAVDRLGTFLEPGVTLSFRRPAS